jgi:DNA-3-methyladenine glycosylase II
MFLIFCLKRPDILSLGDAGLQRAARNLYGELPLESCSASWQPYRSVASWYLWRSLDNS